MVSILNVDQINNAAGTSAVTIDPSTGKPSFPNGATLPAGSVIQVAQSRKTDTTFTTTSTSFVAVPDLAVTLTPASTSSKFLVTASVSVGAFWWAALGYFGVYANGTTIAGDGSNLWVYQFGADSSNSVLETMQWSEEVLYAPSTTSPITFQVVLASSTSSYALCVNRQQAAANKRGNSWITVREIAG